MPRITSTTSPRFTHRQLLGISNGSPFWSACCPVLLDLVSCVGPYLLDQCSRWLLRSVLTNQLALNRQRKDQIPLQPVDSSGCRGDKFKVVAQIGHRLRRTGGALVNAIKNGTRSVNSPRFKSAGPRIALSRSRMPCASSCNRLYSAINSSESWLTSGPACGCFWSRLKPLALIASMSTRLAYLYEDHHDTDELVH